MKNIVNYVSISRMVMSILLLLTKTLTLPFIIIYLYCGVFDIVDGYIARKSKNTSKIGERLDSIADIIFVIVSIIKIVSFLNLPNGIIIWVIIIAIVKICNLVSAYIYCKKLIFPHTIANKITGLILFIAPLILIKNNYILFEIIICSIATFAAIQEGHYIRTKN